MAATGCMQFAVIMHQPCSMHLSSIRKSKQQTLRNVVEWCVPAFSLSWILRCSTPTPTSSVDTICQLRLRRVEAKAIVPSWGRALVRLAKEFVPKMRVPCPAVIRALLMRRGGPEAFHLQDAALLSVLAVQQSAAAKKKSVKQPHLGSA